MNTQQYQQQAKRTCASLGRHELDLSHMALGLNSEIVELDEAINNKDFVNIKEEIGDCFFYLINTFYFLNVEATNMSYLIPVGDDHVKQLYNLVSEYQNDLKRHIAYGKGLKTVNLNQVQMKLMEIVTLYDFDLTEILDKNIAKLKKRFPDKFTQDKAINRDTNAERKILEE